MMRWIRSGLPLVILILLVILLAQGLRFDPKKLPSAHIGKPAPAFKLATLASGPAFAPDSLRGQVWILNVFASWCSACIVEHPRLLRLAASRRITMVGLAYKDNPDNTRQWLKEHGDPYRHIALDIDGRVGIDYGVYGVPETYVIDAKGIIRYRHVGPIDDKFFDLHLTPVLNATPASGDSK